MEEFLVQHDTLIIWLITLLLILIFGLPYWLRKRKIEKHSNLQDQRAERYGFKEPVSLYPRVDPSICIGSGGCIAACPEEDVLGIRNGQGIAINRAYCVGHGLCERSCPVDAITLVFGTEKRGVDLPRIQENFETNIPGIYIVGELGGMGLIRNAFEQGLQCLRYMEEEISKEKRPNDENMLDLIIVGCGPAGLSATIQAKRVGLRFVTLERENIGGTVRYYPRKKLVMTNPLKVPGVGKIHKKEILKEELIDLWEEIIDKNDLQNKILTDQNVEEVIRLNEGFELRTSTGTYKTRRIVLAIGRRGTPRKLGIPGEDLPNVAYSLLEPDHYQNEIITVVGGGDSAIEAALALSEQPGNKVRLSYRKDTFSRLKPANLNNLNEAVDQGKIELFLNTNVVRNAEDSVTLAMEDGSERELPNTGLFIFAGGILPTKFLQDTGIRIDTKFGQPLKKK
tara:strand:- start:18217 stop:19575 length:1359 start_codon:yes stop_codon:yes gene_type:complete